MEYKRIVYGFHGCTQSARDSIMSTSAFKDSTNDYDWLGSGIYFWEDNEERAWQWAEELCRNPENLGEKPAVVCAKIDLGICLDIMQDKYSKILKLFYLLLVRQCERQGVPLPHNRNVKGDENKDWKLRMLDCSVINLIHQFNKDKNRKGFNTVRSAFTEGKRLYPGSAFKEQTHIQLCVLTPESILELINVDRN